MSHLASPCIPAVHVRGSGSSGQRTIGQGSPAAAYALSICAHQSRSWRYRRVTSLFVRPRQFDGPQPVTCAHHEAIGLAQTASCQKLQGPSTMRRLASYNMSVLDMTRRPVSLRVLGLELAQYESIASAHAHCPWKD